MIDRQLNYGRHCIREMLMQARPFTSVVDLGAGSGSDLLIAKAICPDARLHALECSPEFVSEKLHKNGIQVHTLNLENQSYPFADNSIDVVLANQVLEHTKEVFFILHEVSRILKPGGYFLAGVPNLASLHNRLLLACGRQPSPIKTASAHVRGFTRPDFLHFLQSCFPDGYVLKSFLGSNFYPFPALVARPLARLLPSMAWAVFFLMQKTKPYNREFLDFPRREKLETNFYLG